MQDHLNEIFQLASHAGTQPTQTALPGVLVIKGEVPQHQLAAVYEPMIGFNVQGGKTVSLGDQVISLKAPAYFVIPVETPASGRVHQGPDGAPYLSVALRLNPDSLASLLQDLPPESGESRERVPFCACPATPAFVDAWLRMLRLLKTPEYIPALFPVHEREILFHVLTGPQGWRLRELSLANGNAARIRRAVQWIRRNYAKPIDIPQLADMHGMAVTTFHRQFKQLTGLSPLQFQKQLRLLEARKLLVFGGQSASVAAFEVGYESASQFNREYVRLFGAPPARDALHLRASVGSR